MSSVRDAAAVFAAWLALSAGLTGCGADVFDIGPAPAVAVPAPLAIRGAQPDLVFTAADDEDAALAGIQTTVRVDVQDELVQRVVLAVSDEQLEDVVAEDLDGIPCARFVVTLHGAGVAAATTVVATSPDLPVDEPTAVQATLVVAQPDAS